MFKLLKVTSLQYLYNISKKKLVMEFIFDMQMNVKVSTICYHPFWWKWPDMSKIPKKGKLVTFVEYIKKNLPQLLCVLL